MAAQRRSGFAFVPIANVKEILKYLGNKYSRQQSDDVSSGSSSSSIEEAGPNPEIVMVPAAGSSSSSRKRIAFCGFVTLIGAVLVVASILTIYCLQHGSALFGRRPQEPILGVIVDHPLTQHQAEMLIAIETAKGYVRRELGTPVAKIDLISGSSQNEVITGMNNLRGKNSNTFIDLRQSRFTRKSFKSLHEFDKAKEGEILTIINAFPTSGEDEQLGNNEESRPDQPVKILSTAGSLRGSFLAILTKMVEMKNRQILPLVSASTADHHLQNYLLFLRVASEFAPEARILDRIQLSANGVSVDHTRALGQAEGIIRRSDPSVAVILFCDGNEAAQLLDAVAVINKNNEHEKGGSGAGLKGRIWYYPEGSTWTDTLRAKNQAWKVAKAVNLYTVGFLGVNQTASGASRRKMMVELNANLGKGAPFHAMAAFDAMLAAMNQMLDINIPTGITGPLTSLEDRQGNGNYARLMLAPENPPELHIEVLQETPWLIDGVVGVDGPSVRIKDGATSGHLLKKSYFETFFGTSQAKGCEKATVNIAAFDPLTFSKIEKAYTDIGSLPDFLVLAEDNGYAVRLSCTKQHSSSSSAAASYSTVRQVEANDEKHHEVVIHLVCPAKDPILNLPCLHSVSSLAPMMATVNNKRQRRDVTSGRHAAAGDVMYSEIPSGYIQRYLDSVMLHSESTQTPSSIQGALTELKPPNLGPIRAQSSSVEDQQLSIARHSSAGSVESAYTIAEPAIIPGPIVEAVGFHSVSSAGGDFYQEQHRQQQRPAPEGGRTNGYQTSAAADEDGSRNKPTALFYDKPFRGVDASGDSNGGQQGDKRWDPATLALVLAGKHSAGEIGLPEGLRRKDPASVSGEKLKPSPRTADYIFPGSSVEVSTGSRSRRSAILQHETIHGVQQQRISRYGRNSHRRPPQPTSKGLLPQTLQKTLQETRFLSGFSPRSLITPTSQQPQRRRRLHLRGTRGRQWSPETGRRFRNSPARAAGRRLGHRQRVPSLDTDDDWRSAVSLRGPSLNDLIDDHAWKGIADEPAASGKSSSSISDVTNNEISSTTINWDQRVITELSATYGLPENDIRRLLSNSEKIYLDPRHQQHQTSVFSRRQVDEDLDEVNQTALIDPDHHKHQYPPYARWLGSSTPSIAGCIGASTACVLCATFREATATRTGSGSLGCVGACTGGIFANCLGMMGLLFARAYQDNLSVICSELARQGRLSVATYVADTQFGARMEGTNPEVIRGYHFLARPVVWGMQRSQLVTVVVETVAGPWIQQMAFEEGFAEEGNEVGRLMMAAGVPLCGAVGRVVSLVSSLWAYMFAFLLSIVIAGIFLKDKKLR